MTSTRTTSDAPAPDSPTALDGAFVVDLTTSVAGQYAGRLLAMNGADVVLVEPPGGSPLRRKGREVPEGGETFLFRHLNQGKRSVSLDPDAPAHVGVLTDLVSRADVVLRDTDASLPRVPATTVECVIGQAPTEGVHGGWTFDEMAHQALGGVMNMTGTVDREPVYGVGERASYGAGTTAYISIVSALHERRTSGLGQRVDTTVFESVAAMGQNLVSQFSYNGTAETRARYPGFLAVVRCADAWVVMFVIRNWPTLCDVFGLPELVTDPRYLTSGDRLARWPEIVAVVQEKAWGLQADHVVEACQSGRVSAEKVVALDELVRSDQWRIRRVLGTAAVAGDGPAQATVRRIFDIEGATSEITSPSPALVPFGHVPLLQEVSR